MLVKNCINYIIIGIIIFSIPILIYSIITKDKRICKSIFILDIMFTIYLFLTVVVLPNILGLDQGLEVIFTYFISFIVVIIYIISIVVCKKKINKNKDTYLKSNKILFITIVLIILPVLLFFCSFFRECYLIKYSELILESNYQNGFITSETSWYAISENFCKEITINWSNSLNNKKLEYFIYYINFSNDVDDGYEIESYYDKDLAHIDKKIVNSILLDAIKNHNNLNKSFSNFDYKKDETIINRASVTYFENSEYYHVTIGYDINGNGGMAIVNEMIYKDDKYIGELLINGNIESVNYIEK